MKQRRAINQHSQFPFGPNTPALPQLEGIIGMQSGMVGSPEGLHLFHTSMAADQDTAYEMVLQDHKKVLNNKMPTARYEAVHRGFYMPHIAAQLTRVDPVQRVYQLETPDYSGATLRRTEMTVDFEFFDGAQVAQQFDQLMTLLTNNDSPPPREIILSPVCILCRRIYESLYVNDVGSMAIFYVKFLFVAAGGREWQNDFMLNLQNGYDTFIKVRLAKRSVVRINSEIVYMAAAIATAMTEFAESYNRTLADMEWNLVGIRIQQKVYDIHGRFSPIIASGGKACDVIELINHSPDILLRSDMARMKKDLESSGMMLSSPHTYHNCLLIAIDLAIRQEDWETLIPHEKSLYQSRASSIKKGLRLKKKMRLDDFIRIVGQRGRSWLRNQSIELFDVHQNRVGMLQHKTRPAMETRKVFLFGQHAMAVVPKKDIHDEEFYKLIEPAQIKKRTDVTIGYWDMETTTTLKPYMIGLWFDREDDVIVFVGTDCVTQMMKYLEANAPTRLILYAHNGGKFDVPILHKYLPTWWHLIDILGQKTGRIINYKVFNADKKKTVVFLDSYPLIPSSLDELSRRYNVAHPKLIGTVDHRLMTDEDWMNQDLDIVIQYLKHDVMSLAECLDGFRADTMTMYNVDPVGSGMLTGPSISKWVFISRFYNVNNFPLYHLPSKISAYTRRAYHGGRSDLGFRGWAHNLTYYDIVSQYPSVMVTDLPYGIPEWEEFTELPPSFRGFATIRVRGGSGPILTIRVKDHQRGLITPKFKVWTEVVLYSAELRFVLDNNDLTKYEIEMVGGLRFKHGPYLRGITELFFEIKTQAKHISPAAYVAAKARLNSIYGHFVFAEWGRQLVLLSSPRDFAAYFASGNLIAASDKLAIVDGPMDSRMRYVPTGASIASKAYVMLMRNVLAIYRAGFTCFYTDTDSLVTDAPPEIIESVQPIGLQLGDMEPELEDVIDAVFVAPKIYALRSPNKTIVKLKGVPLGPYLEYEDGPDGPTFRHKSADGDFWIGFDEIAGLLEGRSINVQTFRVYGGKESMMKGEGLRAAAPTITITGEYKKGIVDEHGYVSPL